MSLSFCTHLYSVYLSVYLSVCVCLSLSVYLTVCVCLTVLYVCLAESVCLSVHPPSMALYPRTSFITFGRLNERLARWTCMSLCSSSNNILHLRSIFREPQASIQSQPLYPSSVALYGILGALSCK